uniref:Uncharacterized protein n=1 Tax=Plectus sambesii TaxID=2011161 RepID=A0A914XMP5_9BILA
MVIRISKTWISCVLLLTVAAAAAVMVVVLGNGRQAAGMGDVCRPMMGGRASRCERGQSWEPTERGAFGGVGDRCLRNLTSGLADRPADRPATPTAATLVIALSLIGVRYCRRRSPTVPTFSSLIRWSGLIRRGHLLDRTGTLRHVAPGRDESDAGIDLSAPLHRFHCCHCAPFARLGDDRRQLLEPEPRSSAASPLSSPLPLSLSTGRPVTIVALIPRMHSPPGAGKLIKRAVSEFNGLWSMGSI